MAMQEEGDVEKWGYHVIPLALTLTGYRPGLKGIWDHLLAVLFRRPAPKIERDHKLNFCFWGKNTVKSEFTGVSLVGDV